MFRKHILYTAKVIFCMLLAGCACVSCNDWLDVSSRAEVKYGDLFSSKNGFKDQLTGIYTSLCSENLYGANMTYGMMDALGQQYVWSMEAGKYYYLNRFEYDKSTGVTKSVWSGMYNAIANVNILLQGIDEFGSILSEEEEKIYRGEALALRAFLHFDLLRVFGRSYVTGADSDAIPYVKTISNNVTPMSTVSEAIDLVIADLNEASELLAADPIATGQPTTELLGSRDFHFNYYAVRALLARAYLFKNDKANALSCAREVIKSNKFPWVSSVNVTTSKPETRDRIFKSECIFTLNNIRLKSLSEIYLCESSNNSNGNLLVTSTETFNDIFETKVYGFDWRSNYLFENLAQFYKGSIKLLQLSSQYNNRQPIIRVSEMYLIAAECSGTLEDAVEYVNELRSHRGFDARSMINADDVTEASLQTIIGKEYRKEFISEGQWFFYCKRQNLDALPNVTVPFSKSYYVLPIPDQEYEYGNR